MPSARHESIPVVKVENSKQYFGQIVSFHLSLLFLPTDPIGVINK